MKNNFIKENNGKLYKITVSGVSTIEDTPKLREKYIKDAKAHGLTLEYEDENLFKFSNGLTAFKPKLQKVSYGKVFFRAKDYYVVRENGEKSYGNTPKAESFTENSFTIDMFDGKGKIEYKLAN